MERTNDIKFYYNGIKVNGGKLIKCSYFKHDDGINIIADGYGYQIPHDIFTVENGTDIMTDYFENDSCTIAKDHPLYKYVEYAEAKAEAHDAKRYIAWLEKRAGKLLYASHATENRSRETIAKFESMTDPGQPKKTEIEAMHKQNEAIAKANAEAQAKAEVEAKAEAETARAEGEKFILDTIAKYPIRDNEKYVIIGWSEHPAFYRWDDNELKLSIKATNEIFKHFDYIVYNDPKRGYDKTRFYIMPFGENNIANHEYEGRFDIGDGEGGMIDHIRNRGEWYRMHTQYGRVIENPPATNEILEYVKELEKLIA